MATLTHKDKGRQVTVPDDAAEFYLQNGWERADGGKPAAKRSTRKSSKATKQEGETDGADAAEGDAVSADADAGADNEG